MLSASIGNYGDIFIGWAAQPTTSPSVVSRSPLNLSTLGSGPKGSPRHARGLSVSKAAELG